jgi:ATP-dependent DNA helicase DinG
MSVTSEVLAPGGELSQHIPDFAPREGQQQMAEAIEQALGNLDTLVTEAGTGTGKTFAYLVPALLSGGKVIISTGTKNLQDQLFHRDLPVVRKALAIPAKVALLKGRANYLCLHRMELTLSQGRLKSPAQVDALMQVREWSGRTFSGDIGEVNNVPEDSPLWPLITSNADNCLGQECPSCADCFVIKSRRVAQEADLLVINHHLLFADMALKEEGFGELLPGANAFILDEAHQLPDVASNFFGTALGGRQLLGLAEDVREEHLNEAGDMQDLPEAAESLEKAVRDLRLAIAETNQASGRMPWAAIADRKTVQEALDAMHQQLQALCDWLELAAARGKGLENCHARSEDFLQRLELLRNNEDEEYIQWLDIHRRSFSMHLTPLNIAPGFQSHMQASKSAWIFTSATLAVGGSFQHFMDRLGIQAARTLYLQSEFDYARNAVLYVPEGLPDPNSETYTAEVVAAALPVLEESGGRAFLLFTSHRALRQAAEILEDEIEFPLLVQGDLPRGELLERFRELGNAVLLGTSSFWEGVDVKGPALSCVIIDKLPFASPGDPVLQARIDLLRKRGGNPFMDYQLPNAVINLKQGVGRLIRDTSDQGVLMLCDPRLLSKPYGRTFIKSLPAMTRTRKLEVVERFFREVCFKKAVPSG